MRAPRRGVNPSGLQDKTYWARRLLPAQPVRGKRIRRRPAWGKIALAVLVIGAFAAAWRYTALADLLTPDEIRQWSRAARDTRWAPFVMIAAYTPAALLMFPRPVLTLVAVIAFGSWRGTAYAIAGITGAALATYWAGRLMRYDTVRRLAGDKLDPAVKVLRAHGVLGTFALNMVPVPPFAVQGAIAGAARVNAWHYALGSFLGALPTALAWTVFGKQIASALEDHSEISYWLLIAVIVLMVALTYAVRRWFAKQTSAA